jgi:hypothetical protein
MPQTFDNRFRYGKRKFEMEFAIPGNDRKAGTRFETFILDEEIGPESVLVLTDPTPSAYELKREPFELRLKTGVAQTSFGPILFLLWWLPPITNGKPFALFEHILNPAHIGVLEGLTQLARQTRLHLLLLGPCNKLLGLYEFENIFGLDEFIWFVEKACVEYAGMDFAAAQAEYERDYDLLGLFQMDASGK